MEENTKFIVHPYWSQFDVLNQYVHSIAILVFMLIFVLGGFGNLMIILFHLRFENNRRSTAFLMINLALADLLFIITNIPLAIYNSMNGKWMFGKTVCNVYGFFGAISGFTSIATMALISVERLVVLKCPFRNISSSKKFIICSILASWFYGTIWSTLPFFGPNEFVTEGFLTSCTFDYISRDVFTRTILIIMNILGFILPVTLISVSYIMITSSIREHYNNIQVRIFKSQKKESKEGENETHTVQFRQKPDKNRYRSDSQYSSISASLITSNSAAAANKIYLPALKKLRLRNNQSKSGLSVTNSNKTHGNVFFFSSTKSINKKSDDKISFFKNEIKITKFTMLIILSFSLSWLPYALISIIGQFSPYREQMITPLSSYIATLLAKSSTVFNPTIYLCINQRFRSKFWLIFLTLIGKGS